MLVLPLSDIPATSTFTNESLCLFLTANLLNVTLPVFIAACVLDALPLTGDDPWPSHAALFATYFMLRI